ncbi:MAG: PQQ-binding-like beta-propeller repeat protein [Planctomycetes bacterium]|nr:PQQ-binding-like beta-propeller repeat protein [Planctomycetota bacterium]
MRAKVLPPPQPAPTASWRTSIALAFLIIFVAAIALALLRASQHGFQHSVDVATQMLAGVDDPDAVRAALTRWEEQTLPDWRDQETQFVEWLLNNGGVTDESRRRVLTYISGADFGSREKDWERWAALRKRLAEGSQPHVTAKEAVLLEERWDTSIGLTAPFSGVVPIDGVIYVASLGLAFDNAADTADGLVRVNRQTGEAELIFQSPDKPPRDIVGLVAGSDSIIVACRNGFLYALNRDGRVRWKAFAGARIVAPPLGFDANPDGIMDVAVLLESGRVAAFSSEGRAVWTTPLDLPSRPAFDASVLGNAADAIRGSLSVGPLPGVSGTAILATTWHGLVLALSPSNGKPIWNLRTPTGFVSPPVLLPPQNGGDTGVYLGDVSGGVWSLLNDRRRTTATQVWSLALRYDREMLAPLRTSEDAAGQPCLLACMTDAAGHGGRNSRSILAQLGAEGVRWRCPIDGTIRTAPAVADFNADGVPEALVVSDQSADASESSGAFVTIVSPEGFVLRRWSLEESVGAGPVVVDLEGDGPLEVLIADRTGKLHCYNTGKFGPIHWGLAGGDPRNSHSSLDAFTYSQTPNGYQWNWRPGGAKRPTTTRPK